MSKKKETASDNTNVKNDATTHSFSSTPLVEDKREHVSIQKKPSQKHSSKKTSKKEQTEKMERELTSIYENADGSLPDMKSFEKRTGGWMIRAFGTLLFSVLFVGGVLFFGYTKFQQPSGVFVEEDVILSIGGEEEISYGEEVRYRVRFKNAQSVPLSGATIEVRYPAGFVFATSSETPDLGTDNTWTLGALKDGEGAFIDMVGNLYGDVGEGQSFRVFLTYTSSNFSSTFQKVATQETHITAVPVHLSLSGPTEVSQGVATRFDISLQQNNDNILLPDHLALVFEPGGPFALQKMEPESKAFQDLTWNISAIEPDTSYAVTGAFAGGEKMLAPGVQLLGWQDGQTQSDAYVIAKDSVEIALADEQLSIQLVANGSQQDITVQPGENINATVVIKNTTNESLTNVRVRMMFDAPSLENRSIMYWQGIEDSADGSILGEQLSDTVRRGQLTWSSQNFAALKTLDPDEEVTIDVSLPVKTKDQTDLAGYETFEITLASDVQYDMAGLKETSAAVPLLLTLNSDTSFEVRDETDNNVHTVTWLLSNSFHALKDIEAKVDLYGEIDFAAEEVVVPAGEIEYDEDEQQLMWRVAEMPVSIDVFALQFPIELLKKNPSQSQLTSKVTVTATDAVTGKQVLLIGDEVAL